MISKELYEMILQRNYACREAAMLKQAMYVIKDKTKDPVIKEIAENVINETKGGKVRKEAEETYNKQKWSEMLNLIDKLNDVTPYQKINPELEALIIKYEMMDN